MVAAEARGARWTARLELARPEDTCEEDDDAPLFSFFFFSLFLTRHFHSAALSLSPLFCFSPNFPPAHTFQSPVSLSFISLSFLTFSVLFLFSMKRSLSENSPSFLTFLQRRQRGPLDVFLSFLTVLPFLCFFFRRREVPPVSFLFALPIYKAKIRICFRRWRFSLNFSITKWLQNHTIEFLNSKKKINKISL